MNSHAPATPAQVRLWAMQEQMPTRPISQVSTTFRVRGPVDISALRSALGAVIERHEALRSRFEFRGTLLCQVVDDTIPPPLSVLPSNGGDLTLMRATMAMPFDLGRGPVVRVLLSPLSDEESVIALQVHHSVIDGEGMDLLLDELSTQYSAAITGTAPPLEKSASWLAHLVERQKFTESPEYQAEVGYWQGVLDEIPRSYSLRARVPVALADRGRSWISENRSFDAAFLSRLRKICGRHQTTVPTLILGCTGMALTRMTNQPASIGVPYAGQHWAEGERTGIGMSARMLPIVFHLDAGTDVAAAVSNAREQTSIALSGSVASVEDLSSCDDLFWPDIFDIVLHVTMGRRPGTRLALEGTECSAFQLDNVIPKFVPVIGAMVDEDGLRIWASCDTATCAPRDIERVLDSICDVLTEAVSDPGDDASGVSWLSSSHAKP